MQKYYVYIWYLEDSKEVFYVGKGSGNRVTSMKDRNPHFRHIRNKCKCGYKIVRYFDNEEVETGEILMVYNSASEAARLNNMNNESISKCCRGERKTSGGFKWQYQ